jgi:hypothetical protein
MHDPTSIPSHTKGRSTFQTLSRTGLITSPVGLVKVSFRTDAGTLDAAALTDSRTLVGYRKVGDLRIPTRLMQKFSAHRGSHSGLAW